MVFRAVMQRQQDSPPENQAEVDRNEAEVAKEGKS